MTDFSRINTVMSLSPAPVTLDAIRKIVREELQANAALEAAARQALERLRKYHHGHGFAEDAECIAALEAALAQKHDSIVNNEWILRDLLTRASGINLTEAIEMSRCLLHKNKLNDFKTWLDKKGVVYREGRGDFQIMQVAVLNNQWAVVYDQLEAPEHYTVTRNMEFLVKLFINEKRESC